MPNYYEANDNEPTTLISYSVLLDDQVNTTTNTESFEDFVDDIKSAKESKTKEGAAFAPFVFQSNYRNKQNAMRSSMLVFDVDNLPDTTTAKDLITDFQEYRVVCYTSFSHLLPGKGARFRVIFLLSSSIDAKGYEAVTRRMASNFSALKATDPASFSPAQMFYLPKMPIGRLEHYEIAECFGRPFDWKKYLEEAPSGDSRIASAEPKSGISIVEGSRNTTANKYAFSLKIDGFADDLILSKTLEWNIENCTPPLPQSEIEAICRSVAKLQITGSDLPTDFSEYGIAKSLLDAQGEFLAYSNDSECWYGYDRKTGLWGEIKPTDIRRLVLNEIERLTYLYNNASHLATDYKAKVVRELASRKTSSFQRNVEKLLPTITDFLISTENLNNQSLVVGLPNAKCIDLNSITIRDTQPGDYLTKSLGVEYNPNAKCPLWMKSIDEWTCGDDELASYLQRVSGYALSGLMTDHKLYFLYGSGRNGKSVFINTISKLYAAYASSIDPSTLMDLKKNAGQASGDIARLMGYRVVTCNELPRSGHLNDELLKRVTAGDPVVARKLYQSEIEFRPEFKIFMSGNDKPIIQETTDAIWARIALIPFNAKITSINHDLEMQLEQELSGILNWMIDGWRKFNEHNRKLVLPDIVSAASKAYREEMDILGNWKATCIVEEPGRRLTASEAYACYKSWAERCSLKPMPMQMFGREAPKYFGEKFRDKNSVYYLGFRVDPGWLVVTTY